jgi:hypothetical protein
LAGTAGTTVPAGYGAAATGTGGLTAAEMAAGSGNPITSGLPVESVMHPFASEGVVDVAAADAAAKAGAGGLSAKQAYAAKMGLDMLSSGMNSGQAQSSGAPQPIAAAPTTPTINQFGVTGYSGGIPTANVNFQPIQLSKIRGVSGDYTFAEGGITSLGSYSDGGQLLKGPGDGMSDNIPAKIGSAQPARLAAGEFVVPADVVSHLGNGSTDAGAKQLYAMMDKIRKARTGTKKQGKQINPSKFLP